MKKDGVVFENARGKVVVQNGTANIDFNYDLKRFENQYDRAQMWLDNQVLTDCDPYVPFKSGVLRKTGILGTVPGSGVVEWDAPYARYQYYGKVMIGTPPKKLTDIPLQYHHPGTCAYWFEKAKGLCKRAWLAGVRKLGGGG